MEERRNQRRRATDEQMERRLSALEDRMHTVETGNARLRDSIERWGKKTDRNNEQTQEMYEVFEDAKAGFRTLALIGKGAKPVFMIFVFVAAVVTWHKTGAWKWPF